MITTTTITAAPIAIFFQVLIVPLIREVKIRTDDMVQTRHRCLTRQKNLC
jgi:hypothetical protein